MICKAWHTIFTRGNHRLAKYLAIGDQSSLLAALVVASPGLLLFSADDFGAAPFSFDAADDFLE
jgi:hypothetical protein